MTGARGDDDSLPPEAVRAVDRACDQFEEAWRAGRRPQIEDHLAGADSAVRPALLRELLMVEWELRARDGDTPAPGDYYTRFPDAPGVIDEALADAPPRPADRYQLLGELGRGGIGVVYRGRDRRLGRDLAVKVLKDSHQGRADLRRRFDAEARIGSRLQHPAIVPVYELGEFDDRRPFFTMRLVEGRTLAELHRARTDPSDDRPRLLGVFHQVCQAVAYAHSQGVVHRDLKPHNVMVGAFGEVQVMDWGFAKVLGRPGAEADGAGPAGAGGAASVGGALMGTPTYMPPEQARGEVDQVDARADVFGLGAIFCEVLTGRPPYGEGTTEEVMGRAARGELDDALARLAGSGADPELIDLARRCLAADPADRPTDASVVADEMGAHLTSVERRLRAAREEQAAAVAAAAAERRARRLTLGLAVSLLMLSFLGGGAWWWVSRQHADRQSRARLALADAEALRDRQQWPEALAAAGHARELLGGAGGELGERVHEMLADLDTARELEEGRLVQATDPDAGRRFLIERALPRYAHAFAVRGIRVGETDPAEAATLVRGRPASVRAVMVAALDDWLRIAEDGAQPEREWLAAVARQADTDGWRLQVREAVGRRDRAALERLAGEANLEGQPPATLQLLGRALGDAGANETAVAVLRRAQRLHPDDFWVNQYLGFYLLRLRPPKADEAARSYTAALALRPGVATAHANLAYALAIKGDWDGVIEAGRRATELNPASPLAHNNLGTGLHRKGDLNGAKTAFETTIRLSPDYPEAHNNLGLLLIHQGEVGQAIEHIERAIRLAPVLHHAHNNLGLALQHRGDREGALQAFTRAVELQPDYQLARYNRGALLLAWGKPDEAVEDLLQAVRLKPDYGEAHLALGRALARQGHRDRALAAYDLVFRVGLGSAPRYVELGSSLLALDECGRAAAAHREAIRRDPNSGPARYHLGKALVRMQEWDEATAAFGEAARLGFDPVATHLSAARCLREQGEYRAALAAYRRARRPEVSGVRLRQLEREVRETERQAELDDGLPAVLCGLQTPSGPDEMAEYARLCLHKRLYAAAAHLYDRAFAARSALADDLGREHRYHAARAATLAGTNAGCDSESRAHWRAQALAWLRADLALWEGRPAAVAGVRMRSWLREKDLAGLRELDRLPELPEAEVRSWLLFWAEVRAIQVRGRATPDRVTRSPPVR